MEMILWHNSRGQRGFTMLEIIVILGVIAIMAAVLSPMILNYIDDAKMAKADADVRTISKAVLTLTKDVRHFPLYKNGTQTTGTPDIELLRGPGNDPTDSTTSGQTWLTIAAGKTGELTDHLVKNNPSSDKYTATGRFHWKGPYLETLTEDPWGNRYLVNIKNGDPADTTSKVVWVLSAGPNGKIETDPNALADSGPAPGGDDIVARIK